MFKDLINLNSIKKKLFLASMLLVVIPVICIIIITSLWVGNNSRKDFIARATGEMNQVNNIIDVLLDNAIMNLEMMCTHPLLKGINGQLYNYSSTKEITDLKKTQKNSC